MMRFYGFLKKVYLTKKLIFIPGIILGVVLLFVALSYFPCSKAAWKTAGIEDNKSSAPIYRDALDGHYVSSTEDLTPAVVGVMIDNHPDAYPQSGLAEARVVYEAPVEGGLTRYLAIFPAKQDVNKVGPVRSARPYYLDWIREYGDAPYMHCGGSPAALDLIKSQHIFSANEFYNGQYYWRDNSRYAPHNLYTNGADWQKLLANHGQKENANTWSGWKFGDYEKISEAEDVKNFKIKYSPGYEVEWRYFPLGNNYERFVNGKPHFDANGSPIFARNIAIQFAEVEVLDDVGRREIATLAGGESRILRDGRMIRGNWSKDSVYARTRFFNAAKEEILFAPGNTWVEVIPNGTAIEVTN